MGGLPDGSRIKLCTMPPGISSRSLLGGLGFHWHYSVGTNSFRQERVGIIDEPSLVAACGLQVRGRRQWFREALKASRTYTAFTGV